MAATVTRVLLVEDDANDADLIRRTLRRALGGTFEVEHAARFAAALATASRRFDVIVLDLSLPDAHGLSMLPRLQQVHERTPIVVLTGSESESLGTDAVKQGAEDYLLKNEAILGSLGRVLLYAIERHRARERLRQQDLQLAEARAEFESFFNLSLDLLAIARPDGSLERVNPAWVGALGWSEAELTRRPFLELIHPDDRETTVAETEWVRSGRPRQGFRNRFLAQDGSYHWLEWSTRAIPGGRLYCTVRDVTQQHAAATRLEESETRFRALAEGSIEGIVVERVQENFRPFFVNQAAARMFGFDSAAEINRLPSLAPLAPEASLEMARQSWELLASGALPSVHGRVEMRRKDGSPIWVELMGCVIAWDGVPSLQMTLIDVTERLRLERELERLASTDPLTGLPNRRHFSEGAERELRRSIRHPTPLSLLVIDADHFKAINDRHGHLAGDHVLRMLGDTLRKAVREIDLFCRWGGEEFVAMLVGADTDQALLIAERIRAACASSAIVHEGVAIPATVSIGVARCTPTETEVEAVVARADRALYAAKAAGRNAVRLA